MTVETSGRDTMSIRNETFGRMLRGAINSIAALEGKNVPIVEDELAEKVHLAGTAFQRYKTGHVPPDPHTIEIIAEAAVRRGFLSREWLQRFLHAARYPQADRLLDQLCPIGLARPRPPRVSHNLPAPTYSEFIMREGTFAETMDGLGKRSAAVIIVGLGGNGKTSLAREVADRCLKSENTELRFDAVVWVSDKIQPGTTNLSVVLDEIAHTLDYPGITQFDHDEKRREVEQLLRRQRVLVCIDNIETITDQALIAWLLNLPEPSKALITAREYLYAFRRGGWPVELRGMSEVEAWALVHERLRFLRIEKLVPDRGQLAALVNATGGNPKAIEMTLGLVKYEHRSLEEVVSDLQDARGEIFDDLFASAWNLLPIPAQQVLLVTTFYQNTTSGEALRATAGVRGLDFKPAIEKLSDLSLLDVQRTETGHVAGYAMHPLVRAYARARLGEQPELEARARARWLQWCADLASSVGYCWDKLEKLHKLDSEHEMIYDALVWANSNGYHDLALKIGKGVNYYFFFHGMWDKKVVVDITRIESARALADPIEEAEAIAFYLQIRSRQGIITDLERDLLVRLRDLMQRVILREDTLSACETAIALFHMATADFDQAQRVLEESIHRSGFLKTPEYNIRLRWSGICWYKQKNLAMARARLEEGLAHAHQIGHERSIELIKIRLAAIDIDEGHIERAEATLIQCSEAVSKYKDYFHIAEIHWQHYRICMLRRDVVCARSALIEAIDLFKRLGLRIELVEARSELSRIEAGEAD
jgi:hypothetical protein